MSDTPRTDAAAFHVSSLAREEICEQISEAVSSEFARTLEREMAVRAKALSDALRDAISTYGPKDEILVTEERQEAWKAVLRKYEV